VRNQYVAYTGSRNDIPDQSAVTVTDVQAVLAHQRADLKIECHVHGMQNLADLGFAYLVVALVVKIDFVDGSTSGND